MAGITQKSCVTLFFPYWSLKKTVVGYIDVKQQETLVDIVSNTDILLMLLLLIIIMITL